MTSLRTLELRVEALESRMSDVENAFATTVSQLQRNCVEVNLNLGRVLAHLGIDDVTEDEVDKALAQS